MKRWTLAQAGTALLCAMLVSACSAAPEGANMVSPAADSAPASAPSQAANAANSADASIAANGANAANEANAANAADNGEQNNGTQAVAIAAKADAFDEEDYVTDWNASASTAIQLNGASATVSGSGASASGKTVTIAKAGVYVLSGTWDDGQLVVASEDKGTVRLVLNDAHLTSGSSAPIYVLKADKTILTLAEGTENSVTDATAYVYPDAATDEPDAAIFSKDDLIVNGTGSLTVTAQYNDGIKSKDDLKIVSGAFAVKSADDGIVGKDRLAIAGGEFTIDAGGDALKASNDTDADKGWIAIYGGRYAIQAGGDGFTAETALIVEDGEFDVLAGGGHTKAAVKTESFGGVFGRPGAAAATAANTSEDAPSMKGLKAGGTLAIHAGSFKIDSADDALHSNGTVAIAGGQFTLATGDDAIHADAEVSVTGGTIAIATSYEGIEGASVSVSGGDIRLVASDDGINAAGENGLNNQMTISGGFVSVNAGGDGLDANGHIRMSGGTVLVDGPTANGNGAIDYDGTFEISGGVLVAVGSSGMAQATSTGSGQPAISMTFSQTQQAGSPVQLKDADGREIVTFVPAKAYQSLVISTPELKKGATYTLYTGGSVSGSEKTGLVAESSYTGGKELVAFQLADAVTWLNESGVTTGRTGGGFGGGGPGRQGGAPGGMGVMGGGMQGGPDGQGAAGGQIGSRPMAPNGR